MKFDFCIRPRVLAVSRALVVGVVLALLAPICVVHAKDKDATIYSGASKVDAASLLAPPPAPGSIEEKADLQNVWYVVKSSTPQDVALANADEAKAFEAFAPAIGNDFHFENMPHTTALLKTARSTASKAITVAKNYWKRLRPYQLDKTLPSAKEEASYGYPSGHSTHGMAAALVLCELFPEKRDAILDMGRKLGWDRVVLGKHYPTDIVAGRVFAQALVREMKKSPDFQRDLAAAREEIASVGVAAKK